MNEKLKDPGVGAFSKQSAKRFILPNGTFNVTHLNKKRTINETYAFLIEISWFHFFLLITGVFLGLNTIFASLYFLSGGITPNYFEHNFLSSFFFSIQTITTLGYGFYAPVGVGASIISSIEAFIGLIAFSFITGLLYGRFSKPKSSIRFTDSFVLCNHKGNDALMFKIMSNRKNLVVLPTVKVSFSLSKPSEKGGYQNEFFNLELERNKITYLPTTWTLVHTINKDSPLKKYSREQIKDLQGELLILLSYYDEAFNEELHQAFSYVFSDLKIGYRFKKAFDFNDKGEIILDHKLFNKLTPEETS